MSTRTTIWTLFLSALLVILAVFFVARGKGWKADDGGQRTKNTESAAAPLANLQSAIRNPQSKDARWPMFHGGQGLLGRAEGDLADSLAVLWKFKTGAEVKSPPTVADGRVFVGSCDESVYAIDLTTGQKAWSHKTGGSVEAAPCVLEGRVFVGSGDNFLYALDAGTGALKWKYETGGQILGSANWTRSPDGQKTWILVGSYDNKLHCVDAQTGQLVWAYETGNYVNGSPAVADGKCVFGGCDAIIHVVSLADGAKVAEIDSGSYIAASAAFVDGEIYVGNYGNVLLKADLKNSSTGILPVSPTGISPVESNDRQGQDGPATHGRGAHATTGEAVWKYAQSDAPFFSSPAVGDQFVVLGGRDEQVHCVRRDSGAKVWTFKTQGEVNSSPVICGDKVIVGSDDGRLYLLALANGQQVWSYEMGQPVTSSPAVVGGLVVVGCDDGYVYAFGPKAAPGDKT
ncbi:MAG: PQQ-binding-like beta-propeller repeat protein [Planctomycetes bacterium]|nr:PQQ-binding-like beta-propeller repeat protein [Planctomycetota bacterium]